MATNTKSTKQDFRDLQQELRDSAHKVWLAGLGALSTVEEQGRDLFQQLVDKGRTMEKEGKQQVDRARSRVEEGLGKARTRVSGAVDGLGDTLEERMTEVLHRFGVPTRDEIRDLTERVEELTGKVDRLRGGATKKAATTGGDDRKVYHVAPHGDGWKVEAEGASRASSTHSTKEEALISGRELAKNQAPSRVIVHKKDGTFQTEYTYEEPVAN